MDPFFTNAIRDICILIEREEYLSNELSNENSLLKEIKQGICELTKIVMKLLDNKSEFLAPLLMVCNDRSESALHYACQRHNVPMDLISKLIDKGGREFVMIQCANSNETVVDNGRDAVQVSKDSEF